MGVRYFDLSTRVHTPCLTDFNLAQVRVLEYVLQVIGKSVLHKNAIKTAQNMLMWEAFKFRKTLFNAQCST